MTVADIIKRFQALPQTAEVMKECYDGCPECNPDGVGYYHRVYDAAFKAEGDWPNQREKNIVVI
jgi:hypothetical protein